MTDTAYYTDNTNGATEYQQEGMETGIPDQEDPSGGDKINASKNDDDERSRKIFVGGLSWETTVKDLREYFEKYGPVLDCTLKTDPTTGRSRGFGFVLFSHVDTVDKALGERAHLLHGRNIDPKRAKARGGKEPILKIFVGGLDPSVPEAEVRVYFEKYGKVVDIDLPFDKQKNQRRAFCFVTFDTEDTVDLACAEPKQDIGNKKVDVKKATPKDQQGGFGFGGGFGGARGGTRGGFGGGRGGTGIRGGRGGRGGYGQGGWGAQGQGYDGYSGYGGYGQGYNNYDYNQGYGQNYGNYDYNSYYGQGGWGGYGNYNQGSDNSGWDYSNNQGGTQQQTAGGSYKAKRGAGNSTGGSHNYHPYSR